MNVCCQPEDTCIGTSTDGDVVRGPWCAPHGPVPCHALAPCGALPLPCHAYAPWSCHVLTPKPHDIVPHPMSCPHTLAPTSGSVATRLRPRRAVWPHAHARIGQCGHTPTPASGSLATRPHWCRAAWPLHDPKTVVASCKGPSCKSLSTPIPCSIN